MELKFFSIDEVKEFVKQLKGSRPGKGGDADDAPATGGAPAPAQPPAGGPGPTFSPGPAPGAFGGAPAGGAFPGGVTVGSVVVAPEVAALVQRIAARIDGAIASGQPADAARTWLAGQCGPEAANYTMDQLKTVALPKAAMPVLENIAKLMNA